MFDKIDLEFEIPDDGSDRELEAMRIIADALKPLTPVERIRVLRAVCVLHGIPFPPGLQEPPVVHSAPAPHPLPSWQRRWSPRARTRAERRCRGCKSTKHDWRKCPLNFEIVVEK